MKITKEFVVALIFSVLGSTALAGEKLYLQSETIDPLKNSDQKLFSEIPNQKNFIIQFEKAITEANKAEIQKNHFQIVAYVPDDALIVRAQWNGKGKTLKSISGARSVMPFQARWKMSTSLPAANIFNASQRVSLLVKTFEPVDLALITRDKVRVLSSSENYHYVEMFLGDIPELAQNDDVQWIENKPEVVSYVMDLKVQSENKMNDYENVTGYETGTKVMKFDEAWGRGLNGRGQTVAMADTGLDKGVVGSLHQDFSTVKRGFHYGLFAKDWSDPMGHGTHVAGSVMSQGAASGGLFKGGAFNAEMVPQGMWSPMLKNLSVPAKLSDMLTPAYQSGARIHTNSWGSPMDPGKYAGMSVQVDQFMWDHPDMLIIFAAGNSGVDNDKDGRIDPGSVGFPGTAKNVLTVGASENYLLEGGIQRPLGDLAGGKPWSVEPLKSDLLSNNENGIAAFSSRGPTLDGRTKPDVVAPGTNIVSNCSQVIGASPLWGPYNEDYCYSGGTSMSTPLTAGAAAVIRQFLIEDRGFAAPSAALVKAVMMNGADDLYPGQYGEVGKSLGQELLNKGPNNDQGFGRVDVNQSTTMQRYFLTIDDVNGVGTGSSIQHKINVPTGSTVKVTLIYTDAPGTENASRALVNNLDLKVTAGGQVLQSNSSVNNSEQILLNQVSGEVLVEVLGANVPMGKNGKQPFALVVSQ
ncbi:MAG: S8 family serine peptidase [Bdellovibrionales bacterium]|nr:S8 family serine peptidase [Bdellovibrionales bacterium]